MAAVLVLAAVSLLPLLLRRKVVVPAPREVALRELTLRDNRSFWKGESAPFTGIALETYPDGALKSRSAFSNGVLHGISEGWHTNGTLQVREHFVGGISHGVRTKWYASGVKLSEANVEHGKIEGLFRRWHENGKLAEEIPLKGNEPDGVSRSFYPGGALKSQVRLENGKVMERQSWKEGEAPAVVAAGTTK
jgi:antitoxin component YwqK of YwqJK toxin-antitoxin module